MNGAPATDAGDGGSERRRTTAGVERGDPYRRRIGAYLRERFPPLRHGILIVSYFSSNQFLARALVEPGRPMHYDPRSLLGAAALFLFFFHLRVFDEHKDFAEDARHHPQRVLQRGVVTLRDLRLLGGFAILAEAALALGAGAGAFAGWAIAFAFSLLMLREFFAGRLLRRSLIVYATLHMLVMPLLALMVFSFATGRMPWQAPPLFWLYAWVGFFVSFNWEISRKLRAPADERAGVDTYSQTFGTYGAAWLVLLVRVIDSALVAIVGWRLGLAPWFYLALVALFAFPLVGFLDYRLRTTPGSARRMEIYAGMYIVAFDLVLALAIAARWGFAA